jgi:carbamate kinase
VTAPTVVALGGNALLRRGDAGTTISVGTENGKPGTENGN